MEYTAEELEDLATMRTLRARLRACAEARIAECEAMDPAKNWLDMNRQIRAITAADRMVVALYSPPPRCRISRRIKADKPISASPPHFPNGTSVPGEVAASEAQQTEGVSAAAGTSAIATDKTTLLLPCETGEVSSGATRRMTEGASAIENIPPAPAEPAPTLTHDTDTDTDTDPALDPAFADIAVEAAREVTGRIDRMTRGFARWAGIWPDGAPYVANEAGWQVHTQSSPFPFTLDEDFDANAWIHNEILARVNAATRAHGARTGYRFDHQTYAATDPDYWSLSANTGSETNGPAAGEIPSPPCLPWWIIRKPPPT